MAFHPSSRLVAVLDANLSVVRVVEVATARVVASFGSSEDSKLHCLAFSPDGRYLATAHTDQRVDLWDLPSVRRRLEELNLATTLPDLFGGHSAASERPQIDRIELDGADPAGLMLMAVRQALRHAGLAVWAMAGTNLVDANDLRERADCWYRLGQWQLAVADYRASLARHPDFAVSANDLAWCLASVPGRGDPDEAVHWARKAVALLPGDSSFLNTLGAALYRAGRFAEAALILENNITQNSGDTSLDWVFLAMCRQRLGQTESARMALARADQWRQSAARRAAATAMELEPLLKEARGVVYEALPTLPSNVFNR